MKYVNAFLAFDETVRFETRPSNDRGEWSDSRAAARGSRA